MVFRGPSADLHARDASLFFVLEASMSRAKVSFRVLFRNVVRASFGENSVRCTNLFGMLSRMSMFVTHLLLSFWKTWSGQWEVSFRVRLRNRRALFLAKT